jgi:hypothetical protein
VFPDINSIAPGADLRCHIDRVLDENDIVLVVIGPRSIGPHDEQRRGGSPADPMRIETALPRTRRLIPALVSRAVMPQPAALPDPS